MNFKFSIIAILLLNATCFSQNLQHLNTSDSTLNRYLERSFSTIKVVDSCMEGIYSIRFRLNQEAKLYDYSTSSMMPVAYKIAFKEKIDELGKNWNQDFLNSVKDSVFIFIPVLISIQQHCSLRDNFYTKKMASGKIAETSMEYQLYTQKALAEYLAGHLVELEKIFLNAMFFDQKHSGDRVLKTLILKPCLVKRIVKFKGPKND